MSSELRSFFKNLEDERNSRPWYVKLWYFLRYRVGSNGLHGVRSVPSRVRNTYERARYGYGHRDLWSFDNYVTKMLSRALGEFAERTHSYPGTQEFPDYETWVTFLKQLSLDLAAYNDDHLEGFTSDDIFERLDEISEKEAQQYERGKAAMQRFSENLGSMWD